MMTTAPDLSATQAIATHDGAPTITRTEHVWTITLARPAQHNRLDPADVTALSALFEQAREAQPKLLVITGTGEKTFCSGYTLSAIASELDKRFDVMLNQLESLPFVTLAALNGSAYGGATDLALCCDIRLGVRGIRMFMPAAKFGLHYYPDGLRRYISHLGLPVASKLMLTGMTIEADEMLRIGYLSELLEADDLNSRIQAYADATALTEPNVVAAMKTQMQALATQQTDAALGQLKTAMRQANLDSLKSDALKSRVADLLKR